MHDRGSRTSNELREIPELDRLSGVSLTTAAHRRRSLAARFFDATPRAGEFSMRSWRLTLILISVLATLPCAAAMAPTAVASAARPRTVLFDATFTAQRTSGPDANRVGHRQIASGVLLNSTGRPVGRFAFTCTGLESSPAVTRLSAAAASVARPTGDSRSPAPRARAKPCTPGSSPVKAARIAALTAPLLVRDIGDRESLITATVTPRAGTVLRVAVLVRPAANASVIARADQICTRASRTAGGAPTVPVYQLRSAASRSRAAAPGRRVLHRPG